MQPQSSLLQPVYLLVDASGSTLRSGFNSACNEALPGVIDTLEGAAGAQFQLAIMSYSSEAHTLLASTDLQAIQFLPHIAPGGFSSLVAGLRLLGPVIFQDHDHLRADNVSASPALVVIVTDGLPTDTSEDVRSAYQDCCAHAAGLIGEVLVVLSGGDVATSVAGLGQGLARPDVDVVELPVVDSHVLTMVVTGWLTRERTPA